MVGRTDTADDNGPARSPAVEPGIPFRRPRSSRRSTSRVFSAPWLRTGSGEVKSGLLLPPRSIAYQPAARSRGRSRRSAAPHLHLPGADVAGDDRGHHVRSRSHGRRALQVDVLDQPDRRLRRAEHVAVLWDPRCSATTAADRAAASRSRSTSTRTGAARERDRGRHGDGREHDHPRADPEHLRRCLARTGASYRRRRRRARCWRAFLPLVMSRHGNRSRRRERREQQEGEAEREAGQREHRDRHVAELLDPFRRAAARRRDQAGRSSARRPPSR